MQDINDYNYDLVSTVTDISVTTEQYMVLADGKELGKTYSPLTLEDAKYNTKSIPYIDVSIGPMGALNIISNSGFWGSSQIGKDKWLKIHCVC